MDKYLKRKKIFVNPNKPLAESPPPPRDEMSTSTKKVKQEELEVTGVSRSGRVRKKSSKLTDFESPDEIDPRYKRKADRSSLATESATTPEPVHSTPKQRKSTPAAARKPQPPPPVEESHSMEEEASDEEEDEYNHGMKMNSDSDSEANMMYPIHSEEILEDEQTSDEDDDGGTAVSDEEDEDDDDEGQLVMVDEGPKPSRPTNQAMSLYMLEKSTKKRLVVKDGKIVGRKKAQRKDKGQSRFTAYMLWAKEARKDILRATPDMDFSTTSKRLGELWGIVPNSEKFTWRRRAKRMSIKQKYEESKSEKASTGGTTTSSRKFINKASPPAAPAAPKLASPPRQEWRRQDRRNSNQGQLSTLAAAAAVAQQQQQMQLLQQQQLQNALAAAASDVSRPGLKPAPPTTTAEAQQAGMFKSVGTAPVDVASHLKLLGESLLIIGERLKEHEGQIAVSGSFSVLLDSLLCAMAPLICLTQQVPELNGCPAETLSQTLDNIAYIMPGL